MKRYLLIMSLVVLQTTSCRIQPYDSKYEKRVLEIVFQNPELVIPDYSYTKKNNPEGLDDLVKKAKNFFLKFLKVGAPSFVIFNDENNGKGRKDNKNGDIVGFISFSKFEKAQSVESTKIYNKCCSKSKEYNECEKCKECKELLMRALVPGMPEKISDAKSFVSIDYLAIAKDHWRKGFGKKLFEYALKKILKEWPAVAYIESEISEENESAQAFFEKCGFKEVSSMFSIFGTKTMRRLF